MSFKLMPTVFVWCIRENSLFKMWLNDRKNTSNPNQTEDNLLKSLATCYNDKTQPHVHASNVRLYQANPGGSERYNYIFIFYSLNGSLTII